MEQWLLEAGLEAMLQELGKDMVREGPEPKDLRAAGAPELE